MKVIIENVVDRMEGKPEKVLPNDSTIRFEFNGNAFSVTISNDGRHLEIYKRHLNYDTIEIIPIVNNQIKIK